MGERRDMQERYARVNRAWPDKVPELTAAEARTAVKRLWRIATGKPWGKGPITFDGHRNDGFHPDMSFEGGRVTHRPAKYNVRLRHGWSHLVHMLSHRTLGRAKPGHPFHGTAHASHEHMLVQEVLRRGWLEGKLLPKARPKKAKPSKKQINYDRTVAAIKRWERKAKLAETKLKKLRALKKRYDRDLQAEHVGPISVSGKGRSHERTTDSIN